MIKTKSCRKCKGPAMFQKVEHPYWHGINLVALVQDVPAWVCQICGHQYFDPVVETSLGHIVKDYVKIGSLFPIPSTPYREIRSGDS